MNNSGCISIVNLARTKDDEQRDHELTPKRPSLFQTLVSLVDKICFSERKGPGDFQFQ